MKHTIIILVLLLSVPSMAQERVRHIGTPASGQPRTSQTPDTTLSILFNYQQSPSELLDLAGSYIQKAVVVPLVGGAISGGLIVLGSMNSASNGTDDISTRAMLGGGAAVAIISAVLAIIYQYKAGSAIREAGSALSSIRITAGGISYHF